MKHIFSLLISLLFLSYGLIAQVEDYDIQDGDTINKVVNGRRAGQWYIKAAPNHKEGYKTGDLVEEGTYVNGRKSGLWKKYYPNGRLESEINYENSRPTGPYTLYYENGKVEEKGNWQRNKNTGDFKRYHPNGKLAQDFQFTSSGKRTGEQKYYYENGQLRLTGTWQEGMETGEMREYYENGDLMAIKNFSNGVMDKNSVQTFAPKSPQVDPLKKQMAAGKDINVKAGSADAPNQGGFDGNGYRKLYNRDKQISKDGIFKNYRLIDGKYYIYNENGILQQIMIFKGGRYVGDGVIEES
jgi:antitoxin component YwqK of YwqJK toxin-antitoxin module